LEIGPAIAVTGEQLYQMTTCAADQLARTKPIAIRVGKVLYHSEAIMLAVTPAAALAPLREAAINAASPLRRGAPPHWWTPHITPSHSTADQPAKPIIEALRRQLPEREIHVEALSLVMQDGPEREWNWTVVGSVNLCSTTNERTPSAKATG